MTPHNDPNTHDNIYITLPQTISHACNSKQEHCTDELGQVRKVRKFLVTNYAVGYFFK